MPRGPEHKGELWSAILSKRLLDHFNRPWGKEVSCEHELCAPWVPHSCPLTNSWGEDGFPLRLWPQQKIVCLVGCDAALVLS